MAMVHPEPKRGMHSEFKNQTGISKGYLSNARTVLRHLPDKAEEVLIGTLKLDRAYALAKQSAAAGGPREDILGKLRNSDPDLAELVVEGTLDLELAEKQADLAAIAAAALEPSNPFTYRRVFSRVVNGHLNGSHMKARRNFQVQKKYPAVSSQL